MTDKKADSKVLTPDEFNKLVYDFGVCAGDTEPFRNAYAACYQELVVSRENNATLRAQLNAVSGALVDVGTVPVGQNGFDYAEAIEGLTKQLDEANKRIAELSKYVGHSEKCIEEKYPEAWHCTCGLSEALSGTEGKE